MLSPTDTPQQDHVPITSSGACYPPELASLGAEVQFQRFSVRDEDKFKEAVNNRPHVGVPHDHELPEPLPYSRDDYVYSEGELSKAPPPRGDGDGKIRPNPTETDTPEGLYTPQSKTWTIEATNQYTRGFVMTAPWSPEEKAEEERRLANLVTPKNVAPSIDSETGKVTMHPISGMVQLIPGLSSAYIVDGVPMTSSACHTLASIKEQYPDLYPTVLEKAVRLAIGTWGNKAQNIVPVYSFQGKNHNARSNHHNGSDCPDGSFSEASTVMEVSAGVTIPAAQSNTTPAKEQMGTILVDLSDIYDIMLKISLSKAEYVLVKWQAMVNNIISFGGFKGAACTSVQLNISSSKRPLKEALGFQGAMHVDDMDALSGFTVFNLLMRIPPGACPGPFLLGRSGLYIREQGVWIVWIIFKGRDIHGGFAPTVSQAERRKWLEEVVQPAWDLAGEADRAGYVSYQGSVPAYRLAAQSMTRSLKFGNGSVGASYLDKFANFANEGHTVLGGDKAYATRHGWEAVLQLLEYLRYCNMELSLPIAKLLSHIQYLNPSTGEVVPVAPLPFDPAVEGSKDCVMLRHWTWYKQRCEVYSVKIRRAQVKEVQRSNIHHFRTPEEEQVEELRRHLASGARIDKGATHKGTVEVDSEGRDYSNMVVSKVTNLKDIDGKLYLDVIFEGETESQSVKASRLQGNSNCVKQMHQLAPPSLRSLLSQVVAEKEQTDQDQNSDPPSLIYREGEEPVQSQRQSKRLLEDSNDDEGLVEPSRKSKKLVVESDSEESLVDNRPLDTGEPAVDSTRKSKRRLEDDADSEAAALRSRQSTPNSDGEPEVEPPRKRCRKRSSSHQAESEDESESEEKLQESEYVVEKVLGERKRTVGKGKNKKQECQLKLKFKGYKRPEWTPVLNVYQGCEALITAYIQRLVAAGLRECEPRGAVTAWEKQLGEQASRRINNLFDKEQVLAELESVRTTTDLVSNLSTNKKHPTLSSIITSWLEHSSHEAILDGFVSLIPDDDNFSHRTALLYRAQFAVNHLATLTEEEAVTTLANRICRWKAGHALIHVYSWFSAEHENEGIGYAAARMLQEKGFEGLEARSPPLARLTGHLMHFLYKIKSDHAKIHLSPGEVYHEEDKQSWGPEPQPDEFESLPSNIYGLRSTSKIHRSAARIPLNAVDLLGKYAKFPWAATSYLSNAISRILESKIMGPSLLKYDKLFPKAPKAGTTEEDVIARTVLRGALLSLVVKGVGTDAVLASDRIVPLIQFPNFIAGESGSNKLRDVVKKVLNQMESLSETALSAIAAIVDPETERAFKEMGTILHDGVVKYTSPRETKRGDRYQRTGRPLELGPLPMGGVLPSGTPNIGMVNFLLRESLQERKGLGAADEVLGRILRGQHATRPTTAQGYNPDHTNPSRHHNYQSVLLEKHLGQSALTGPFGLSNLLVFFGTGQGWKTAGFLEYVGRTEQGLWSESVADVSRKFNSAMVRNMDQVMAAVLHYDNALQWGTANNHLLAQPTIPGQNGRRQTLEEKFGPYFQQTVLDEWTAFLGGMAGEDHRTWEGEKRGWKEALELLDRLKLSGIAGLTALQLVNSLALLGLVTMPEISTLADWIWARPQLGAFRGLERLGFTLINTNATRFAFDLVYHHIANSMSEEDQRMIGFSTIFVEHLLCKVIRWDRRLKEDGCHHTLNSLLDMALKDEAKGIIPAIAFPCSWEVSDAAIQEALTRHAYVAEL